MLILGLDTETTGLHVETSRVIELGFVFLDVEKATIFDAQSYLIFTPDYPAIPVETTAIHGLDRTVLLSHGNSPLPMFEKLGRAMQRCDYICGHGVNNFDKPLLEFEFERNHLQMPVKPWIDTSSDLAFPSWTTSRRLAHLAADHKLINPMPHRALFDVMTSLALLTKYDLRDTISRATSPTIMVYTKLPFDKKELAKERRYFWNEKEKIWVKRIKQFDLENERKAPFEVQIWEEN